MGCKWLDERKKDNEDLDAPSWCDIGSCDTCGYYYPD